MVWFIKRAAGNPEGPLKNLRYMASQVCFHWVGRTRDPSRDSILEYLICTSIYSPYRSFQQDIPRKHRSAIRQYWFWDQEWQGLFHWAYLNKPVGFSFAGGVNSSDFIWYFEKFKQTEFINEFEVELVQLDTEFSKVQKLIVDIMRLIRIIILV